jgi:predicted TIM-barrel fold metal-dependent hydrolase
MQPSKIIDSHQHVFWHHRNDAELVADMDAHGIESAWLLSWEIMPSENAQSYHRVLNPLNRRDDGTHSGIALRDLLQTRDRYPERFKVGYCPHPCVGNAADMLYSAVHIHDVRVCGEWKFRVLFDDPRCLELFHAAGELKVPVVLHLDLPYFETEDGSRKYDPNWYGGTVENLERALQACPETNFIGHAPGFWREMSGGGDARKVPYPDGRVEANGHVPRLLREYSNLFADLSAGSGLRALKRDSENAKKFVTEFSDKLLFARDYYGQQLHEYLQTLELSDEVGQKIYWQNAERLLKARQSLPKPAVMSLG